MRASNVVKLNTKIKPDDSGVYRTKHFYRDQYTAMFQHMNNMIKTYGKGQVAIMIRDLIASGGLNGND
jgi:hypothetical protein